ncbi:hypothetical protein BSLG_010348 [Batrachochytrium salamandrivorans]|nr:hypothetical protein BSLG_010348 [Batrachochytrium salamandrivorans]
MALLCILQLTSLATVIPGAATWQQFQSLVCALYYTAANETFKSDSAGHRDPLLPVNVVLQEWCGYNVWDFAAEKMWVHKLVEAQASSTHRQIQERIYLPGNTPDIIWLDPLSTKAQVENTQEKGYTLSSDTLEKHTMSQSQLGHVAVGGTFDHLHAGHRILLTCTAWLTRSRIVCGVMDPDSARLEKKTGYQVMESTQTRIDNVKNFLHLIRRDVVSDVVAIQDDYGPTRSDALLEAIVGSGETLRGCNMVNQVRSEGNLNALQIFIIDVISPTAGIITMQDFQSKISSTYLRMYILSHFKDAATH